MTDEAAIEQVRTDFIEQMGLARQADGLPRIAGRLLGLLIFDGEAVSFGDLATRLKVSRGSISSNIRILEERGLIKRTSKPGERQDYLQLAATPYSAMLEGIQKRNRSLQNEIAKTIQKLPTDAGPINRLQDLADFHTALELAFGLVLSELNKSKSEPTLTPLKDRTHDK
jgi:DNA-binding transcriptional regulator GbsR (MarR family)